MPKQARVRVDREFVISKIDPRLYGGFAEHLGRHIYTGMYEPGHPTANAQGFRQDVIDLVKELQPTVVRYPGGNFVSGYLWEDGVGPKELRPRRLELAWGTVETNEFGTNEFIDWCKSVGTEPLLATNLGTRGAQETRDYVEYCNHPSGSALSDLRRSHGYDEPHDVRLWCLGNEMDGPWQMGKTDAKTYGIKARAAGQMVKWIDSKSENIVCGSSHKDMDTFGTWEIEVLNECYDVVDYISTHVYYGNSDQDLPRFLSRPDDMSEQIEKVAAVCDAVGTIKKTNKKIHISFDEWNVWYHSHGSDPMQKWTVAPAQLEDVYDMADVLVVGGMLITLINHADRVKIACIAQLVNVIGPIMTQAMGPAWRQTIFYPFRDCSRHGRGEALQCVVDSPTYDCKGRSGVHELLVAVTQDEAVNIFAVNRSLTDTIETTFDLRGFDVDSVTASVVQNESMDATNTAEAPDRVEPEFHTDFEVSEGKLMIRFPKLSWNVVQVKLK